ncbi:hypothetical protein PTTG_12119 [Puccinia triticina 1-1 BBBD Race 1]|uniref:Uncharacterized protein n=1 Tax=Puccinia triticina (isolate 1-1 / race 1 (BBBD)) TaxID=630390 RepID=A0A180GIC3_PUCT1|nr:hypothetical protein PTTG_12119 [Puccinia triticina 1-1 BBBD Race 1]
MVEEMVKRATRRLAKNALSQGDMPQGGTLLNEQQASDDAIRTEDNSLTPNSSSTRKVQGGPELVPDGSESDDSEAFKEVPGPVEETGNETGAIAARYKALLSKVPQVPDPTDLIVVHDQQAPMAVKEPNSTSVPTVLVSNADKPKKSQKERLWEKVTEAVSNNDAENTEFFMGLYTKLSSIEVTPMTGSLAPPLAKPDILRAKSSDAVIPAINVAKRSAEKTTIVFIKGSIPRHFDVGFTPYFDKNIREFRGPLPLTIFGKDWQEDAIQAHTNKRSRSDEKDGNYTGFEYPNEWTQSL